MHKNLRLFDIRALDIDSDYLIPPFEWVAVFFIEICILTYIGDLQQHIGNAKSIHLTEIDSHRQISEFEGREMQPLNS